MKAHLWTYLDDERTFGFAFSSFVCSGCNAKITCANFLGEEFVIGQVELLTAAISAGINSDCEVEAIKQVLQL